MIETPKTKRNISLKTLFALLLIFALLFANIAAQSELSQIKRRRSITLHTNNKQVRVSQIDENAFIAQVGNGTKLIVRCAIIENAAVEDEVVKAMTTVTLHPGVHAVAFIDDRKRNEFGMVVDGRIYTYEIDPQAARSSLGGFGCIEAPRWFPLWGTHLPDSSRKWRIDVQSLTKE